jgi:hypothetical protein
MSNILVLFIISLGILILRRNFKDSLQKKMTERGFDELIEKLKEQHPDFHRYNQIYANETSKVHSSFLQHCAEMTGSSASHSGIPEIGKYKEGVFDIENDAEKKEKEILKNYWGIE